MNMYLYKDIVIIASLLNICTILCGVESTQNLPQTSASARKLEFFSTRKPSLELPELVAIIQATTTLHDAAQALETTKKRVAEKINTTTAAAWLSQLDATYSAHITSSISFIFNNTPSTVTSLFERYHELENKLMTLIQELPTLDDEHKSDHLDTMLMLVQQGKEIEEFLNNNLVPHTIVAQQWAYISKSLFPLALSVTKSMDAYIPYKVSPALLAEFNALIESLRATKTLKTAQLSYSSTQTWIAARLAAGDITPAEAAAWNALLNTTFNDQTTKRLPQLQIAQMYAKANTALKTLKGYETV